MVFEIKDCVALISGGASGIGLHYVKELLKNHLKGVTIADLNEDFGEKALKEIENEFGSKKAIFVKTDVTNQDSFENAFKKTIEYFGNLDILINNAGILNDAIWQREIEVNLNGTINGVLLAQEKYISKYKTRSEGLIVNISSIFGLDSFLGLPIYSATKFAVIGLTKAIGNEAHFARTKVRAVVLCPGVTDTPLLHDVTRKVLNDDYGNIILRAMQEKKAIRQRPENVSSALIDVIKHAKNGDVWVAEDNNKLYQYVHPSKDSFVESHL